MGTKDGWIAALALFAAVALTSCEENVVAVRQTDRPYTLYGVLNPLADTQFVRVFPLEGRLSFGVPDPLGAEFVMVDVATGVRHVGQYTQLETIEGDVGHFFSWPLRVGWGQTYRLAISGPDGRASSAEVTVPDRATLVLEEPDTLTSSVRLPAIIRGDPPHLYNSEVEVAVKYVTGFDPVGNPFYRYVTYHLPYERPVYVSDGNRRFIFDLDEMYYAVAPEVQRDLSFVSSRGITLLMVQFSTLVASEDWDPPGGVFDPNLLIEPGVMTNVENGFGFIGAGYLLSSSWTLPLALVEKTYFVPNR